MFPSKDVYIDSEFDAKEVALSLRATLGCQPKREAKGLARKGTAKSRRSFACYACGLG